MFRKMAKVYSLCD